VIRPAAAVHNSESPHYNLVYATVETPDSAMAMPSRIPTRKSILGLYSFARPTTANRTCAMTMVVIARVVVGRCSSAEYGNFYRTLPNLLPTFEA
jgi:hypothetical protein